MKFDCGEEWEEKKARLGEWHKFFAIIPRKLAPHDCRWLETIERRCTWCSVFDGRGYWKAEYRAIDKSTFGSWFV